MIEARTDAAVPGAGRGERAEAGRRRGESCSNGSVEPSDRELMRRLARGEREALDGLMQRHYARVYRIALGYLRQPDDALDVAQEAFVKAYRNARMWDERAEPGAWLTRITVNAAIDRYRRARRRRASEEPLAQDDHGAHLESADAPADRRVLGRELRERIERALCGLPERQRAVFVLRHHQELPLEEIGRTLGMNLGTVKSNLHRALLNLRRRLAGVRP